MGHKKNKKEQIDEKHTQLENIEAVTHEVNENVHTPKKVKKKKQVNVETIPEKPVHNDAPDKKEKKKRKAKKVHFKTEVADDIISQLEPEEQNATLVLNDITLINSNNQHNDLDHTVSSIDEMNIKQEVVMLGESTQNIQQPAAKSQQNESKGEKSHKARKNNGIDEGLLQKRRNRYNFLI